MVSKKKIVLAFLCVYFLLFYLLWPSESKSSLVHADYPIAVSSPTWYSGIFQKFKLNKKSWGKVRAIDRKRAIVKITSDIDKFPDLFGPSEMGSTKRILILTTWRSGSTFLSELLNSLPASYHHYEPLMEFQFTDLRDSAMNELALQMVADLFYCRYENLHDYLEFAKEFEEMFSRNANLWKRCSAVKLSLCCDKEFLKKACPLFPLQVMKTVRLPLNNIENLLNDQELNLKVIFLVRDPRAIISSRNSVKWCNVPRCSSPRILCHSMEENYQLALKLTEKYPTQFTLLRYEDLAMEPMDMSRFLFTWLELPWLPEVEDFVIKHTNSTTNNPWGTEKAKGSRIAAWKSEMNWPQIQYVQDVCSELMEHLGYLYVAEESLQQDVTFVDLSNSLSLESK